MVLKVVKAKVVTEAMEAMVEMAVVGNLQA
jgi:hypothetical protein